jgi:transposase-like protein
MLVMQNLPRPVGDPITAKPACPNCGRSMHLARTTPRTGGFADLQTYRCGECGVSLTEAADDRSAA